MKQGRGRFDGERGAGRPSPKKFLHCDGLSVRIISVADAFTSGNCKEVLGSWQSAKSAERALTSVTM